MIERTEEYDAGWRAGYAEALTAIEGLAKGEHHNPLSGLGRMTKLAYDAVVEATDTEWQNWVDKGERPARWPTAKRIRKHK